MSLLCKLGLHKVAAQNLHVQRESDGVWFDVTQNRCEREDCPKSLWWRTVDMERAYHQIDFNEIPEHRDA